MAEGDYRACDHDTCVRAILDVRYFCDSVGRSHKIFQMLHFKSRWNSLNQAGVYFEACSQITDYMR